jgi:hypothetical protein
VKLHLTRYCSCFAADASLHPLQVSPQSASAVRAMKTCTTWNP